MSATITLVKGHLDGDEKSITPTFMDTVHNLVSKFLHQDKGYYNRSRTELDPLSLEASILCDHSTITSNTLDILSTALTHQLLKQNNIQPRCLTKIIGQPMAKPSNHYYLGVKESASVKCHTSSSIQTNKTTNTMDSQTYAIDVSNYLNHLHLSSKEPSSCRETKYFLKTSEHTGQQYPTIDLVSSLLQFLDPCLWWSRIN